MPRQKTTRHASHSGTWYSSEAEDLASQIQQWLGAVPDPSGGPSPRAIIAPHAGYRYSGHVMAHSYRHVVPENVSRVFLLGPSHHVYAQECMLSRAATYSTPLGDMEVDKEVYNYLTNSGLFRSMSLDVDEAEHSLELHLPYIAWLMRARSFTLVPIMVGALDPQSEAAYGKLLAPFLDQQENLFVISSDFCHWGSRFNFTFYDESQGQIFESIRWLDLQGVEVLSQGSPEAFREYMHQYSNTICGRHPIAVLLQMMKQCESQMQIQMTHYDQSSQCTRPSDSSVSYVAAIVRVMQ